MNKNDIKQELLKKKAQLAELKRRKKERDLEKISKTENSTQTSGTYSYSNNTITNSKSSTHGFDILQTFHDSKRHRLAAEFENLNANEILDKCGINDNEKDSNLNKSSNNTVSTSSSVSISLSSSSQSFKSSATAVNTLNGFKEYSLLNSNVKAYDEYEHAYEETISKKIEHLHLTSTVNPDQVDIYPYEPITYNKETQTINSYDLPSNADNDTESIKDENEGSNKPKRRKKDKPLAYYDDIFVYDTLQWEDEYEFNQNDLNDADDISKQLNLDSLNLLETQLHLNENFMLNDANNNKLIGAIQNLDLDHGEDEDLMEAAANLRSPGPKFVHTEEKLLRFLNRKRPLIERCLNQNAKNIFFDYSATSGNDSSNPESSDVIIKLKRTFASASSSVVTCLDWSQQNPDLLLCSYDNMAFNYEEAASETVAVIWNSKSDQKTPQQIFTCTSLITSCIFAPFNSNLIIAGTYSGQIAMWDMRCNKPTPIQRSALSVLAHVNPVYCIKVAENKDSHTLISISNDGKLCSWSLENLNQPIETHELSLKNTNRNVYATCLDFQTVVDTSPETYETEIPGKSATEYSYVPKTFSKFKQFAVVGAEDGLAHTLEFNNSKFSTYEIFNDHLGPVTSVSCYNRCTTGMNEYSYQTNESLSQLFLTSSFDSTVKLWDVMDHSKPIHTFECNGEYVYDVCWSPIHPAVFACVDGSGKLDLWDLNNDTEMPSASIDIDNGTRALNKLKWSRKGTEIAVGDEYGQISIFEIHDSFAKPKADETQKFLNTVDSLKQLSYESDKIDSLSYYGELFR